MKKLIFICLSILTLLSLAACSGGGGEGGGSSKEYTVTVVAKGATVTSSNPVTVKKGESAVFDIEIGESSAFRSVSVGEYDSESGKLTVSNGWRKLPNYYAMRDILGMEYMD